MAIASGHWTLFDPGAGQAFRAPGTDKINVKISPREEKGCSRWEPNL